MYGMSPAFKSVLPIDEDMACGRCKQTFAKPLELPCEHIQCRGCTEGTTHCFTCGVSFSSTALPHSTIIKLADKAMVQCCDCGATMTRRESYAHHCIPGVGGQRAPPQSNPAPAAPAAPSPVARPPTRQSPPPQDPVPPPPPPHVPPQPEPPTVAHAVKPPEEQRHTDPKEKPAGHGDGRIGPVATVDPPVSPDNDVSGKSNARPSAAGSVRPPQGVAQVAGKAVQRNTGRTRGNNGQQPSAPDGASSDNHPAASIPPSGDRTSGVPGHPSSLNNNSSTPYPQAGGQTSTGRSVGASGVTSFHSASRRGHSSANSMPQAQDNASRDVGRHHSTTFALCPQNHCKQIQPASLSFHCAAHPDLHSIDDHDPTCFGLRAQLTCEACKAVHDRAISLPAVIEASKHVACSCANQTLREDERSPSSSNVLCSSHLIAMTGCTHRVCNMHLQKMLALATRELREDNSAQHMRLAQLRARDGSFKSEWVLTCRVCYSLGIMGGRAGYIDPFVAEIAGGWMQLKKKVEDAANYMARSVQLMVYCASCAALTPKDKYNGRCAQCSQVPCRTCSLSPAHCLHENPSAPVVAHALKSLLLEHMHVTCQACAARLPVLPAVPIEALWASEEERNLVPCHRCRRVACGICGAVDRVCKHSSELQKIVEDDGKAPRGSRPSTRAEVVLFYRCVALCRYFFEQLRNARPSPPQSALSNPGTRASFVAELEQTASFPIYDAMWFGLGYSCSLGDVKKSSCMTQHCDRRGAWGVWVDGDAGVDWKSFGAVDWEFECAEVVSIRFTRDEGQANLHEREAVDLLCRPAQCLSPHALVHRTV